MYRCIKQGVKADAPSTEKGFAGKAQTPEVLRRSVREG